MAKLIVWDGTEFPIDDANESAAYDAMKAYLALNPQPIPPPPEPPAPPAPTRDSVLEEGYVDQVANVKLQASIYAQSRFTAMTAGYRNKQDLGKVTDSTPVAFYDYNGEPVFMTLLQYKELMDRYQDYCASVEAQF
jgi:hypothetical protein